MKVVVIPDVHLKKWLFDMADDILTSGKAERAVCLMDIPDDWNKEFLVECYKETFDRAIDFSKDHPDTLWCYGNHDISYLWGKLESGYSVYAEAVVISKLEELKNGLRDAKQIAFIHRLDNVLFMHGGLTREFVRNFDKGLLNEDIDDVLSKINAASQDILWNDESPLWFRPQYSKRQIFRNDRFKQVVGHTPVDVIFEKDGIISTDVFSTYRNGRQIGESAMIVIDTETGEFEKTDIQVM